jgi:hypothetical protein
MFVLVKFLSFYFLFFFIFLFFFYFLYFIYILFYYFIFYFIKIFFPFYKLDCQCNGHTKSCTDEGVCYNCQGNTQGTNCESCLPGFMRLSGNLNDSCTRMHLIFILFFKLFFF